MDLLMQRLSKIFRFKIMCVLRIKIIFVKL